LTAGKSSYADVWKHDRTSGKHWRDLEDVATNAASTVSFDGLKKLSRTYGEYSGLTVREAPVEWVTSSGLIADLLLLSDTAQE
jgi:hypothetical protein